MNINTSKEINIIDIKNKKRNIKFKFKKFTKKKFNKMKDYGYEYFDDKNYPGYSGFKYNGAYKEAAAKLVNFFKLKNRSKVLDVGCAKGFLLHDIKSINKQIVVRGIDVSKYAIDNSLKSVKRFLKVSNSTKLPFKNKEFDLTISIDVLQNLDAQSLKKTIKEIKRVSKESFLVIESYDSKKEKKNLLKWEILIKTCKSKSQWRSLLKKLKYNGYFYSKKIS